MSDEALPSSKDNLFTSQDDWWNNACPNWFHNGWSIYSTGYKDAADILVDSVISEGQRNDTLVYPIVFLYRQYLELALKNLIRQCLVYRGEQGNIPKHHQIVKLWSEAQEQIALIFPGEATEELDELGRLIGELSSVDPTSTAFRYPEEKDGMPTLQGMKNLNLRNLKGVLDKMCNLLYGVEAQVDLYSSYRSEMEADISQAYEEYGNGEQEAGL
jgi:hypothetical protein